MVNILKQDTRSISRPFSIREILLTTSLQFLIELVFMNLGYSPLLCFTRAFNLVSDSFSSVKSIAVDTRKYVVCGLSYSS